MKEFELDDMIKFPENIFRKRVKEYLILLAPDYSNWIVLEQNEEKLFDYLLDNSIKKSMIFLRDNNKIPEDKVIEITQRLLAKIEKCKFYKETYVVEEEPMSVITKSIHINLTNNCNLRCKHCYMSAGLNSELKINFISISNFLDVLYEKNGRTEVVISGGEPLVYKDIYRIIEKCKSLGHKVILFTNGLLINRNNISLISQYVDEIQISMEGISKYCYESIRGINTYNKLLDAINLIKEYNISLTLAITLIDSVLNDVNNNIINFIESISIKKLNIRLNDEIEFKGNMMNNSELNYMSYEDKKLLVLEIIKKLNKSGHYISRKKERNIKFSNCGIGTSVVVNYDGKIYPCNEFGPEFYSIDDCPDNIMEKFNEINEETSITNIKVCQHCELKHICVGSCRVKNYLINNNFNIPYCNEEYKNKKYYDLLFDYWVGKLN